MKRLALVALIVAVLVPAGIAGAFDLNDDLDGVNQRIDNVNAQIRAANVDRTGVVDDILATRDRLELRRAELAATRDVLDTTETKRRAQQNVLDGLRNQLEASYQALAKTREDLDASRQEARQWVYDLYVGNGDRNSSVALSAESVTTAYVGFQYLQLLAAHTDRAILNYESLQVQEERQQALIEADEAEVAADVADLQQTEADLADLEAKQAEQADAVAADLATLNSKLDTVDATIAEFNDELDGLEAEQGRIEQLIKEEASQRGTAPSVLVRPVPGAITSGFGMRLHPILGYTRMHTGVDMHAGYGEPIKAAATGRVILAGPYGGYGNAVIIDHGGGMTTLYGHQSSLNVSYGDEVSAGDVIGYVGSSGLATGPHLHFEVRINGVPVDPEDYI
jgi:murein DD-endopeptidase MepM/ murein hydrolase activator NlpD